MVAMLCGVAAMAQTGENVLYAEDINIKPGDEFQIAVCLKNADPVTSIAFQINNLPADAVVETNALFERDVVRPVYAGAIKPDIKALIMPHVMNHERIMKAVLGGNIDVELITEAFETDPLMKGKGTKDKIRKLVTDMMRATL